jgi:hypothetical protein
MFARSNTGLLMSREMLPIQSRTRQSLRRLQQDWTARSLSTTLGINKVACMARLPLPGQRTYRGLGDVGLVPKPVTHSKQAEGCPLFGACRASSSVLQTDIKILPAFLGLCVYIGPGVISSDISALAIHSSVNTC